MRRTIDLHERIMCPYWVACAILEIHADCIVRPAMDELRVAIGGTALNRRVTSEVGPRDRDGKQLRTQLRWHAEEHPRWFPVLEAEIVLEPAGDAATELRLIGEYEPPLGAVGALGDWVVGNRLAESSLREFLASVARRLSDEIAARADGTYWKPIAMSDERLPKEGPCKLPMPSARTPSPSTSTRISGTPPGS